VNESHVQGRRGHGYVRRTVGDDPPIVSPCCGMDDHIGPNPFDHTADRDGVPHVELLADSLDGRAEGRPDDRPPRGRRTVRRP
jgi:hypothetical protein